MAFSFKKTAGLVTFTEEILNGKLNFFLCSVGKKEYKSLQCHKNRIYRRKTRKVRMIFLVFLRSDLHTPLKNFIAPAVRGPGNYFFGVD